MLVKGAQTTSSFGRLRGFNLHSLAERSRYSHRIERATDAGLKKKSKFSTPELRASKMLIHLQNSRYCDFLVNPYCLVSVNR